MSGRRIYAIDGDNMNENTKTLSKIILATHNPGKIAEIGDLLPAYGVDIASANDYDLPEPEETGATFTENALLKARAAAQATGLPAIADDSGLCVNALNGRPGIYSARWAGPEKDFDKAMRAVRDELNGADDWSASFFAVIALCWPNKICEIFEGHCEGRIVWPPRGAQGFGYDPMFLPAGDERTFGEMGADEKHAVSHRGKAILALGRLFETIAQSRE